MTPSPGINYNFVAGAYLVCSVIFGVLLCLDKVGKIKRRVCLLSRALFFNQGEVCDTCCTYQRTALLQRQQFLLAGVLLLLLPMIAGRKSYTKGKRPFCTTLKKVPLTAAQQYLFAASVAKSTADSYKFRVRCMHNSLAFPPNGSTNRPTLRGSSLRILCGVRSLYVGQHT